jgi:hypothetical protein
MLGTDGASMTTRNAAENAKTIRAKCGKVKECVRWSREQQFPAELPVRPAGFASCRSRHAPPVCRSGQDRLRPHFGAPHARAIAAPVMDEVVGRVGLVQ